MANKKITDLNPLTGAASDVLDVYPVVDVSGTETKKQTRAELFKAIPAADFADTFVFNDAGADKDARFEGDTDQNLIYTDASTDRVGIGTATPVAKFQVNGGMAASPPSVITTDFTVIDATSLIINNKAGSAAVITLPTAATSAGRYLHFINKVAFAINSSAANVLPRTTAYGGTLVATIVSSGVGNWSLLWCDGTSWYVVAGT